MAAWNADGSRQGVRAITLSTFRIRWVITYERANHFQIDLAHVYVLID